MNDRIEAQERHLRSGRAATARMFGVLMTTALDEARLRTLQAPAVEESLAALGVRVPRLGGAPEEVRGELERLAAELERSFLSELPDRVLSQSLVAAGGIHRDARMCLSAQARSIGVDLDLLSPEDVRSDHIGVIFQLWAAAADLDVDVANHIASHHLCWAERQLGRVAELGGFYGHVAAAARALILELAPSD